MWIQNHRGIEECMNKKDIGAYVRTLRENAKISQQELSKRTKISQAKISKVEHGKLELSLIEADKIFKALKQRVYIGSM